MLLKSFLLTLIASTSIGQVSIKAQQAVNTSDTFKSNLDLYRVNYPPIAREKGLQGTVIIMFDIDSTCSFVNRRVTKGIGGGCEEEVMKSLDNAARDLKMRTNNMCIPVKDRTHEVKFKL